jgi:hypothetical protein
MLGVWRVFKLAARTAVWRTTPDPPLVGLGTLLGIAVAIALIRIALQLGEAASWRGFNPYGLNAVIAWLAVELAIAALFVRPAARATALSVMFMLSTAAEMLAAGIRLGAPYFVPAIAKSAVWTSTVTLAVMSVLAVAWWIAAVACLLRSLEPQLGRLGVAGRVISLCVALFAASALMPHIPVFLAPDFDMARANWWEAFHAYSEAKNATAAQQEITRIEKAQTALLQTEIAQLAPARKGTTEVYALGVAGWASQDVFLKELAGGLAAISGVLPIKDRTLRLINSNDTLGTVPLANPQNFTAAVHALGEVMDKDEDVLVLLMTSHGEQSGFALQVPGANTELTPQQVAAALDKEGIKNRVVIVSACFAGIFVPPLANDDTIVVTAADAKSTSFGCAPERDWTYFGDAFFRQSLRPGTDFENAFEHARVLIHGWELMDHVAPSNPQGHFGAALVDKLAPILAAARGNDADGLKPPPGPDPRP